MPQPETRYSGSGAAHAAEGWNLQRLTKPSRLFSANGIRTGKDGRIYVAQVAGSQVSAIDVDTGDELWRFEADGRLLTPPAVGDQTLFIVSFPGIVYALD